MEQEFQRVVLLVVLAGSCLIGAGSAAVYLILRRFGGIKAGGSTHMALMFGLVAFVFLSCLALFGISYIGR